MGDTTRYSVFEQSTLFAKVESWHSKRNCQYFKSTVRYQRGWRTSNLSIFQDNSFSAWRYFVTKWEVLLEAGGRYLETLLWRKVCWTVGGRWNQNSRRMQASCMIDLLWQVLFLGTRFEILGAPAETSDYHKTVQQITAYTDIILHLRPLSITCGWFLVEFCRAKWPNRWSFSLPWGMSTAIDS